MKKLLIASLSALTILLGACSNDNGNSSTSSSNEPISISFAYELPDDHPWGHGAKMFKEMVEEESDGQITIEIYGNGSLAASGREIQESVSIGTIDMGISSTPLAQMNPYLDLFSLPYIFENREMAWNVLDGEVGQTIGEKLSDNNLQFLSFWEDGLRQVTNNTRPINKLEDFKGLKIRVPESEVRLETFKALGSNPLPMAWSEVFTALQQGAIDGQENPLSVVTSSSFYDVQQYLTITNHVYSPATLFMNSGKWADLNDNQKEIIMKAAKAGQEINRKMNEEQDNAAIEALEGKGMEISEIENIAEFQEVTESVWNDVVNNMGGDARELLEKIKNSQ